MKKGNHEYACCVRIKNMQEILVNSTILDDMTNNFYITPKSLRHLERHFGEGKLAGSYFLRDTFESPADLLKYLENATQTSSVIQTSNTTIFNYSLTDGRMAGMVGIAKRNCISKQNLSREIRDGITIDVGIVDELQLTPEFCIVARRTSKGSSIITAFPGGYARPFARNGQPSKEYSLNKLFWDEHALIRLKS